MLTGAGGNVTAQVGTDGVLLVDTQFAPMAPKILAAVRKLSDKPIRYIINTHVHTDHSGGNEGLAKPDGATIVAHENVLKVMKSRDMSVIIRNRVQDMIKKGMTLKQVQASKPTWDYEPLYGATSGLAATDSFIEDLYNSLTAVSRK